MAIEPLPRATQEHKKNEDLSSVRAEVDIDDSAVTVAIMRSIRIERRDSDRSMLLDLYSVLNGSADNDSRWHAARASLSAMALARVNEFEKQQRTIE